MKVTLYTIDCDHCKILEKRLRENGIDFDKVNIMENVEFAMSHGFKEAPVLGAEGRFMNFQEAMEWAGKISPK